LIQEREREREKALEEMSNQDEKAADRPSREVWDKWLVDDFDDMIMNGEIIVLLFLATLSVKFWQEWELRYWICGRAQVFKILEIQVMR